MTDQPPQAPAKKRRLGRDTTVAALCGLLVAFMVGASYAAVPFYNWFCRATGFNGTTMVATSAPSAGPLARTIAVRFDSNVSGGLPWKFVPEKSEITVRSITSPGAPVATWVVPLKPVARQNQL